jgi:hypothetical protein
VQHGVFKFIVKIPLKYPSEAPRINFIPSCAPFHPLVDLKTGVINFQFFVTQVSTSTYGNIRCADHLSGMKGTNSTGQWDVKRHRLHNMLGWLKSIFFPHSLPATQELLAKVDMAGDPAVAPFQIFNPNPPWVNLQTIFIVTPPSITDKAKGYNAIDLAATMLTDGRKQSCQGRRSTA